MLEQPRLLSSLYGVFLSTLARALQPRGIVSLQPSTAYRPVVADLLLSFPVVPPTHVQRGASRTAHDLGPMQPPVYDVVAQEFRRPAVSRGRRSLCSVVDVGASTNAGMVLFRRL